MSPASAPSGQAGPDLHSMRRTAGRLPLTMRPSVMQQIDEYEMLFPFEQKRLLRFLRGIDSLSAEKLERITAPLRRVETEMGVVRWNFSEMSNTMENSAQLARSARYAEWRVAVTQVFAAIEERTQSIVSAAPVRRSLVVTILPGSLPVTRQVAWAPWKTEGTEIAIRDDASRIAPLLFESLPAIGKAVAQQEGSNASDSWVVDAETRAGKRWSSQSLPGVSCLSWPRLDSFRAEFLAELNTIPRDTHIASQTLTNLKRKDWSRWWPQELAGEDRLRNFVVDLYLTGNGAIIFPSAFVEWGAAEIFRRARPPVLIARFGLRNKPKPFTSIAIFENQSTVSAAPEVPDAENSAMDAAMLARYVWLSTLRYQEYEQALCICIAEHLNMVRMIAPSGSGWEPVRRPLSSGELQDATLRWLNS